MRLLAIALLSCLAGCPRGARSVDAACGEGATIVEGSCASFRAAEAFCGKNATPAPGGCARKTCGLGEALDIDHGMCLPESAVLGQMVHGTRSADEPKQRTTCPYGWLGSQSGQLKCVVGTTSCGRGERWVKTPPDAGISPDFSGKCEADPVCGAGEIFDEISGKCARVVRNGQVDLGTWARLALGSDGAEGTNAFCAPVRASGAKGRFDVQITVPENDVTRASARLVPSGTPPNATDAAERSLEELVQLLHFYGGTSLAASASLTVTCTPPAPMSPTLELVNTMDGGKP